MAKMDFLLQGYSILPNYLHMAEWRSGFMPFLKELMWSECKLSKLSDFSFF